MSNLANIIKNIDPPIELTQTQYNALSTQQKNNGLYYVNNDYENGIGQEASSLVTDNSNVQAELDNLNDINSNILSGQQYVNTANYLVSPYTSGIYTNQYGNFVHNSTGTGNNWTIKPYSYITGEGTTTDCPLRVYFETGRITARNNTIICYGKGDTTTLSYEGALGTLTSSGTSFNFDIPLITSASSVTVTSLKIYVFSGTGGYAYMKTGDTSTPYVALNNRLIWENSAQVYTSSINSIATTIRANRELHITVSFATRLASNSSGSTNMTNNIPVALAAAIKLAFS